MNRINFTVLALLLVSVLGGGCEKVYPKDDPEAVVKKFYGYIAERGPTALDAAYKMIDERDELKRWQFDLVIRKYASDFNVFVLDHSIDGDKATVNIEYRVVSIFGGDYKITNEVSLNLDSESNAWKVDFTGETHDEDVEYKAKYKALVKNKNEGN